MSEIKSRDGTSMAYAVSLDDAGQCALKYIDVWTPTKWTRGNSGERSVSDSPRHAAIKSRDNKFSLLLFSLRVECSATVNIDD